jgi:hypothetical protein
VTARFRLRFCHVAPGRSALPCPPLARFTVPARPHLQRFEFHAQRFQAMQSAAPLSQVALDVPEKIRRFRKTAIREVLPYPGQRPDEQVSRPSRHDLDVHLQRRFVRQGESPARRQRRQRD